MKIPNFVLLITFVNNYSVCFVEHYQSVSNLIFFEQCGSKSLHEDEAACQSITKVFGFSHGKPSRPK